MTHFIIMAGLHGYLPNYCDVCDDHKTAVQSLAQVHEIGKNRTRKLSHDNYLELNLERDGNEYAEIQECDCDTPWVHSDSITEKEWKRDHQD